MPRTQWKKIVRFLLIEPGSDSMDRKVAELIWLMYACAMLQFSVSSLFTTVPAVAQ